MAFTRKNANPKEISSIDNARVLELGRFPNQETTPEVDSTNNAFLDVKEEAIKIEELVAFDYKDPIEPGASDTFALEVDTSARDVAGLILFNLCGRSSVSFPQKLASIVIRYVKNVDDLQLLKYYSENKAADESAKAIQMDDKKYKTWEDKSKALVNGGSLEKEQVRDYLFMCLVLEKECMQTLHHIFYKNQFSLTALVHLLEVAVFSVVVNISCIKWLIQKGANINSKAGIDLLNSAPVLHSVVMRGNEQVLDCLLQMQVDVLTPYYLKGCYYVPLDSAICMKPDGAHENPSLGNIACAKLLLQHALVLPERNNPQDRWLGFASKHDKPLNYPDDEKEYVARNHYPALLKDLFVCYSKAKENSEAFSTYWQGDVSNADTKSDLVARAKNLLTVYADEMLRKRSPSLFGSTYGYVSHARDASNAAVLELRKFLDHVRTEKELISALENLEKGQAYSVTQPASDFRAMLFWLQAKIREPEWRGVMLK